MIKYCYRLEAIQPFYPRVERTMLVAGYNVTEAVDKALKLFPHLSQGDIISVELIGDIADETE